MLLFSGAFTSTVPTALTPRYTQYISAENKVIKISDEDAEIDISAEDDVYKGTN